MKDHKTVYPDTGHGFNSGPMKNTALCFYRYLVLETTPRIV
jgi:hypothetical protein